MGLLNVGSLVLGLIAWILPVVVLMRFTKHWAALSILSMTVCAIAICFQIYYNYHLVRIEDWAALMDTTWAVVFSATVLLVVTILLNVSTLIVYRDRTIK